MNDTIRFTDCYQTALNAGTYTVSATLDAPEALAPVLTTSVTLHVAGPRFSLPPAEIRSVFPPENGEGDFDNVLPHVVLERCTLPWERLVDTKTGEATRDATLERIPFLALLLFTEREEASGEVTPPTTMTLAALGLRTEPGDKPTDKVSVIEVRRALLEGLVPSGEELRLLTHGRERVQDGAEHRRAVVVANRLPGSAQRHVAHLVMLENRYRRRTLGRRKVWLFDLEDAADTVRLITLKSWQFTCSADEPTLRGRLLGEAFTFEPLGVPAAGEDADAFRRLRQMSYAALPYHLRHGGRAPTLYHGPLVASQPGRGGEEEPVPASSEGLVRVWEDERVLDVSLAAAWQLGRLLLLRDQGAAMAYHGWRRRDARRRAARESRADDGHLRLGDDVAAGSSAMPASMRDWCRERLLLRGLPFEYLVPDPRMLPTHSLRIFGLHTHWLECLLSGALALGRSGEADRRLEAHYLSLAYPEAARERSGFLLRSPSIEEHPDLEVTAFDGDRRLEPLRLERLGTGLMLGLYRGSFSRLAFALPPIGLHFGLKEGDDGRFSKDLRDEGSGAESGRQAEVSWRGERVVDIDKLGRSVHEQLDLGVRSRLASGRFAFQMCEGVERVEFSVRRAAPGTSGD